MNKAEHLVSCLGEEGCDIGQIASKINRFGAHDVWPNKPNKPELGSNLHRLIGELNDLLGVAQLMVEEGILPADWYSLKAQQAKSDKVRKYMAYARTQGTLTDTQE